MNTDAVCMGAMGFDPMADRGTPPFESCDSTLRLAEDAGLGTRDLRRIEVAGTPIVEAGFDFAGCGAGAAPIECARPAEEAGSAGTSVQVRARGNRAAR